MKSMEELLQISKNYPSDSSLQSIVRSIIFNRIQLDNRTKEYSACVDSGIISDRLQNLFIELRLFETILEELRILLTDALHSLGESMYVE